MRETPPVEVFFSYSHKDEVLKNELITHLKNLQRLKLITSWHDRKITGGQEWKGEIDKHLNTAKVILLLVSPDFIASDYCNDVEVDRAMERHKAAEAVVIPVILRPCAWESMPFGHLQPLPENRRPVTRWEPDWDEAFLNIQYGIRAAAEMISGAKVGAASSAGESDAKTGDTATDPETTLKVKIKIKEVTLVFEGLPPEFSLEDLKAILRDEVGVDTEVLKFKIQKGSVKVFIEGDSEEVSKIIEALRDPEFRRDFARRTRLISITYAQEGRAHFIPVKPFYTGIDTRKGSKLIQLIREAIRAVPAVKYALGMAALGAAVAVVAGFRSDFRIAIFGTALMLALALGLIGFSAAARRAQTSRRLSALTPAWLLVLLTCAASLAILSGFFFSWPKPLQAYLPQPTPSPTPRPGIQIIDIPPKGSGPDRTEPISGKVSGVDGSKWKVVIFARSDNKWFVQPYVGSSDTAIRDDGTWGSDTHLGSEYAALLVETSYRPTTILDRLPDVSGPVLAIARVRARE
jgi:hypothetical protein